MSIKVFQDIFVMIDSNTNFFFSLTIDYEPLYIKLVVVVVQENITIDMDIVMCPKYNLFCFFFLSSLIKRENRHKVK